MELAFSKQVVYAEELARARVPSHPGTGVLIAGPTIIRHGTDEQRARWLGPLLRADLIWAQAFSEPDAGSDLPSLQTRAVRVGDEYVVDGQKVWSSWADIADGLFALVRTGRREDRDKAITYLVIDARAPGVTIRPIVDMSGVSEFSEITFDGVRVPLEDRIGPENGGWAIARTSLGHERSALALSQARFYRRVLDELFDLARATAALEDPILRHRLADLEIAVRIMGYSGARTIAAIVQSGEPGANASVSRLLNARTEQRLHEVALQVLGTAGLLDRTDPHAPERGRWAWGFLRTRASTIGAGTSEIQRNTIGEGVLGLPRDPVTYAGTRSPDRER
jgi:alkylation response protein AidB-like acyl-CoA dehydrogenase